MTTHSHWPYTVYSGLMSLDIGGFDTTLYPWGQENIELSIRVWLCGTSSNWNGLVLSALLYHAICTVRRESSKTWLDLLSAQLSHMCDVWVAQVHQICGMALHGTQFNNWLSVGGVVIRQPCSRVAHTYRHLFEGQWYHAVWCGVLQRRVMLCCVVLCCVVLYYVCGLSVCRAVMWCDSMVSCTLYF